MKIEKRDYVDFLMDILLLKGSAAVDHNHSSSSVIYAHTSSRSHNTAHDDNVSYWEWVHTLYHIGDTKAPKGYE